MFEKGQAAITVHALPAPIAGGWQLLFSEDALQKESKKADKPHSVFPHSQEPRWLPAGRPEAFLAAAAPLTTAHLTLESAWGQVPSASRVQAVPEVRGPAEAFPPRRSFVNPGAGPEAAGWCGWQGKPRVTPRVGAAISQSRTDGSPRLQESTRLPVPPTLAQKPNVRTPDRK